MTIGESMIGAAALIMMGVALAGSFRLFVWSIDMPRKRWWGFVPFVFCVWVVLTGYAYTASQVSVS